MLSIRRVLGISTPQYGAVATQDAASFSAIGESDTKPLSSSPSAPSTGWWAGLSFPAKGAIVTSVLALVLGLGLGLALRKAAAPASVCSWSAYRLPTNVVPTAYNITWSPTATSTAIIAPFTFSGVTSVDVTILSDSPCILIHSVGLAVSSVTAQTLPSGVPMPVTFKPDVSNDRLILTMPFTPTLGSSLRLTLQFTAPLATNNVGLYLSKYVDDGGNEIAMLATQFEATYARRAFPSFDEPGLKANYTLTVDGVPASFTPLGNMPVASTSVRSDGALTVTFQTTPRLSTYLVAFVAGPLVSAQILGVGSGRIPVTAWAVDRANNSWKVGYAAQAAAAIIPFYEDLYKVPFPLPKMDMAAIPDFAAGAMENMGLVTYRETAMLANVTTSSSAELQRVVVVVAHELAHQWFGDLTTMQFWNSLWLNEGFASFMEFLGTTHFAPGFGYNDQFQSADVIRALKADAFADVQILTQVVTSSAEIEGQFSAISYSKGASFLQMLKSFLDDQALAGTGVPPSSFFNGVSAYLKKHYFGNAEPSALWAAMADASTISNLPALCQTYELQPGFAVINVAWADPASETTGSGVLTLSQQRFFLSPASAATAASKGLANLLYWIPISLQGPSVAPPGTVIPAAIALARATRGFTGSKWLDTTGAVATIGSTSSPFQLATEGYVKVGINTSLYARVNYPPSLWAALRTAAAASAMGTGSLSPADRGALLDDSFAFAFSTIYEAAGITTVTALQFAAALIPVERSYEGLIVFLSNIGTLTQYLVPDVKWCATPGAGCSGDTTANPFSFGSATARACFDAETRFVQTALSSAVSYLGWDPIVGETPLVSQLRASVLSAASFYGDVDVIVTAKALWDARDTTPLNADVASLITNSVVRWDDTDALWAQVLQLYIDSVSASDSRRYLSALAATRNRGFLQAALDLILTDSVRVGDKVSLLTGVASNPWGRDLAWVFLKANWVSYLAPLYGSGGFDLSSLVGGIASQFQTKAYADDAAAFFGPGGSQSASVAGAVHDYNSAVESVGRAIGWQAVAATSTCTWLTTTYPPPPIVT